MKSWRRLVKNERGAVQIVEAAFIFPIMFLILIALIFMGNAFVMKSQVNSVVTTYAIRGASYCSDSFLETVRSGELPSYKTNIEPYSGIFSGKGDIESAIGAEVVKELHQ